MSTIKTTLIGANTYFENLEDDLFKNLELPEGLDKDVLTQNILLEGGEFEVLYANPIFLQDAIGTWSKREYNTFLRWVNALSIEYAPLENYDRHEDWTDTLDSDSTSRSNGTIDTSSTDQLDVSAYDSSGYQPKDKTTSSVDTDTTDSNTSTLDNTGRHIGRVHGNIGVTTSQQMLESELDLGYWNIYSRITEMFIKEFCIMIYS
jgi:hypothetical protein